MQCHVQLHLHSALLQGFAQSLTNLFFIFLRDDYVLPFSQNLSQQQGTPHVECGIENPQTPLREAFCEGGKGHFLMIRLLFPTPRLHQSDEGPAKRLRPVLYLLTLLVAAQGLRRSGAQGTPASGSACSLPAQFTPSALCGRAPTAPEGESAKRYTFENIRYDEARRKFTTKFSCAGLLFRALTIAETNG